MLSYGFYNSKGGDRKYDAEQFGAMFNGLITDGVFAHYKDALKVTAGSGNRELVVKPGRAWFNGTWTEVDGDGHSIYLMGSAVEATYFVYLAVNKTDRKNTIAWYSNIVNNNLEKGIYFYLLAQVTVPGGATKISETMITDTRGSDLCPYVTGIVETVSFEEIVKRVCGDSWQDWLGVYEAGITTGVQNAVATSKRALDEVRSMKAYAVETEAVSYIWAKFEAVPTGGGGFEWATDSVHTELSDPPMPMCLFRDLSYADLGPGFKPSIALNSPYIAEGETAVKAIPAVTQSKVWREYPYFWEGGAAFGTDVLRYDDLQRVVVNVGGTATEKYRYRTSRLMRIPVTYEPGAYIGTVSADNATAYPRDGYKDGYYYMRFAAKAEDVSFYYPGLSAKNVKDAIIEVVKTGGNGSGTAMSVIEVEELPSTGIKGAFYIVKKPGDSDAIEYLWLDRWERVGGNGSGQNLSLDTTLTQGGKAADSKAVGDALDELEEKIPTKPEDIGAQPKGNYLTSAPVTAVNGKTGAVQLSAEDVGARPNTWTPTAQEVRALPDTYTPPNQTAEQVGADPKGTAASAVSAHNTSGDAHGDLRLAVQQLQAAVNAFLDVDDTTRDELSEVLALIDANADVIEGITTGKVNVADIIDNLTTNVANKPLSAAQGVVIKGLIDGLSAGKLDASKLQEAINTALAQAKASGEFDGKNGDPGVSPTVTVSAITGGHRITITDKNGTKTVDVMDGEDGDPGDPGRGIKSIARTSGNGAAGTTDTYTITYTDNTTSTFQVRNGSNGTAGQAATFEITGATALPYGAAPTVTEAAGSTEQNRKYVAGIPAGKPGEPGDPGRTPVLGEDYWTPADKAEIKAFIATELAKRGQLRPEPAASLEWLQENGDTSKLYVLLDKSSAHYGYIYGWYMTEVETGPSYTNVLPLAINADGTPYVGTNGEKGYKVGYRLNSSRTEVVAENRCCTGFIPVKSTDTVRVKNIFKPADGNPNGYVHFYGSDFTASTGMVYECDAAKGFCLFTGDIVAFVPADVKSLGSVNQNASDETAYMRISTGVIDDTSIITINEEIVEGGGTTTMEYAWVNTGHAFVPADYEPRIIDLEQQIAAHAADIESLKKGTAAATPITTWDAPIYDANIPVFQLSAEKAAMTNAAQTPADIYARYDALMAKHPQYITKTDLGLCSDGANHVYRYDFRESDSRHTSGYQWSETKAKAIIVSGIHFEWAGIYGLYYALEEIAENPDLYALRRNTHLIVVPCMNPYATIAANYQSGLPTPNSQGVRNANGVEIHRNFEVGWTLTEEGTTHYGGPAPLSEVETQYVDAIMQEHADAALFLTCHNFGDKNFNFIWPSTATPYMCNMGYRLIDKLSRVWLEKYGDELVGLEEYRTDDIPAWDNRLGFAHISMTPGTETRQATKYGIQSANVEINGRFWVHGTEASPEPSMSAFSMSRGAEVYVNFLLTAFGVYDPKDKKEYAPATV